MSLTVHTVQYISKHINIVTPQRLFNSILSRVHSNFVLNMLNDWPNTQLTTYLAYLGCVIEYVAKMRWILKDVRQKSLNLLFSFGL